MTYELAKELKEVGFPQREANGPSPHNQYTGYGCGFVYPEEEGQPSAYAPTLEEIIEACVGGSGFLEGFALNQVGKLWWASVKGVSVSALDPKTAVARLWLTLNKKHD